MSLHDIAATRINFLNTELDLANSFVELAKTELKLSDRQHSQALLQKAQVALDTVKRLMADAPKMASDEVERIARRCDELESSIQSVPI